MKILSTIFFCFPIILSAQVMTDSTNVINGGGMIIRFTTTHQATNYADGDSLRFRSTSTKKIGLVSPLSFPVSTTTQTALDGKQATLISGTNIKTVNGNTLLGSGDVSISGSTAWGSVTGTLSNQTDLQNALNAKQASGSYAVTTNNLSDLSNATTARSNLGLVIGTNVLAPNGSAASLTTFPTLNQNTTGTASNVTGVVSFANGGISAAAATSATTGTMTVNMTTSIVTITPTGACTFNASGGVAGQIVTFAVTTSGTTSFVLTFGTNFRKVGTLATGTVSARFFSVTFICINGTTWQEIARTAAQT